MSTPASHKADDQCHDDQCDGLLVHLDHDVALDSLSCVCVESSSWGKCVFLFGAKDFWLSGVMGVMLMKKVNVMIRLLVAVGLMSLVSVKAQDSIEPVPSKVGWEDLKIEECEFHGLPLSDVVSYLREEFRGVHLVTAGPVDKVNVDLELRSVGLKNILRAVEIQQQGFVKVMDEGDDMISIQVRLPKESKPVLKAFSFGPYFNRIQSKLVQQQGWQMDEILKEVGDDKRAIADIQRKFQDQMNDEAIETLDKELYSTIQTSLDSYKKVLGDSQTMEMPKLQLHMSSKLVIVIGQPDAVDIVAEIVQAMNGNSGSLGGGSPYGMGGVIQGDLMDVFGGAGGAGRYGSGMGAGSSNGGGFSGFGGGGGSGGYGAGGSGLPGGSSR